MNRPIKFRVYRTDPVIPKDTRMKDWEDITSWTMLNLQEPGHSVYMQFTGLRDKNGLQEVYEGDIVDVYGKIIGNKYETPMVKGDSPIIIEGLGTSAWSETEKAGLARGLKYSE